MCPTGLPATCAFQPSAGTIGSSATPGGTINLGTLTIDLHGALLANYGTISDGTVHVYYGSLAAGNGGDYYFFFVNGNLVGQFHFAGAVSERPMVVS